MASCPGGGSAGMKEGTGDTGSFSSRLDGPGQRPADPGGWFGAGAAGGRSRVGCAALCLDVERPVAGIRLRPLFGAPHPRHSPGGNHRAAGHGAGDAGVARRASHPGGPDTGRLRLRPRRCPLPARPAAAQQRPGPRRSRLSGADPGVHGGRVDLPEFHLGDSARRALLSLLLGVLPGHPLRR